MSHCCQNLDELQACLQSGDFSAIPTAQTNLRNFELPIGKDDVEFLSGQDAFGEDHGVDFYANPSDLAPQRGSDGNLSMSVAHSLIRSGLRFRTDFVLDAIAIIAHVEPYAWLLNGNRFNGGQDNGQEFFSDLPIMPPSPIYPSAELTLPIDCPSQLEWGGPTIRAAHYFMQSYRLSMLCPDAANTVELLDERLSDLGNCHIGMAYNGFGECGASQIYGVRRVNRRLKWLTDNNQVPNIPFTKDGVPFASDQDLGYFLPFNTDYQYKNLTERGVCEHLQLPERMFNSPSAYGSGKFSPYMCQWYRLPVPRVISHEDNLEILLKRDSSDNAFYHRMLQEMAYHDAMSPIPDVSDLVTTITTKRTASCSMKFSTKMCRIPGGQMRVGIALKGHMIDSALCCRIKQSFNSMGEARAREAGIFRPTPIIVTQDQSALTGLPDIAEIETAKKPTDSSSYTVYEEPTGSSSYTVYEEPTGSSSYTVYDEPTGSSAQSSWQPSGGDSRQPSEQSSGGSEDLPTFAGVRTPEGKFVINNANRSPDYSDRMVSEPSLRTVTSLATGDAPYTAQGLKIPVVR